MSCGPTLAARNKDAVPRGPPDGAPGIRPPSKGCGIPPLRQKEVARMGHGVCVDRAVKWLRSGGCFGAWWRTGRRDGSRIQPRHGDGEDKPRQNGLDPKGAQEFPVEVKCEP